MALIFYTVASPLATDVFFIGVHRAEWAPSKPGAFGVSVPTARAVPGVGSDVLCFAGEGRRERGRRREGEERGGEDEVVGLGELE